MRPDTPKNTWDKVLGSIEPKVSAHSFKTWFGPTRFVDEDAASVRIHVPNTWFAEWLKTHYMTMIQQALRDADRSGLAIEFQSDPPEGVERTVETQPVRVATRLGPQAPRDLLTGPLDLKEDFVILGHGSPLRLRLFVDLGAVQAE